MFLFPGPHQEDPLGPLLVPGKNSHNFSLTPPGNTGDRLRSLNVPFCINIMAGGRYSAGQMVSFTSLSDKEHFHLEKKTPEMPDERIEMHHHDYFELMYVFEGEVEHHIENGCFQYQKGTACLMNRNTRHYEVLGQSYFLVFLCMSHYYIRDSIASYATTGGEPTDAYRFFTSNLDDQAQYQKDYLEFIPLGPEGPESINKLMDDLARELILQEAGYSLMVLGMLSRVLSYFQDTSLYACAHVKLDSSAEAYLFDKVTRYMENKTGRVSRGELAAELSYSSDYINRIVKKHSGMSISEYNKVICLKKAERMLTETNASVSSIIGDLGFENKTHFYKLFDRKHGMTPMEYRKHNPSQLV
ncbi:MAG: AraC family transcriptional regulator [Clostridiales bacterium]|jgi:AraC-like DNA-binding protein/mannose-6-phosphate isomerase-like protein (cupin superfamily)|nr:AraC family transcriptional regulator [Clostridiales bacterium]MDR2750548.1 AraC family transcriptional regulator [Clostridiales bacterium]